MKAAIFGLLLLTGAQNAVGIGNDNPAGTGGSSSSTNNNTIGLIISPKTNVDTKSTAVSGANSESKSTSNSDSKSSAISGDSTSIGIGVGGDSKSYATGGDSTSKAVSGDSSSNSYSGDSNSKAISGNSNVNAGDVVSSINIQGDNFPEIAQSAASVIAQSCQEGSSAQGISAGLSSVFDSAQCAYLRQASINLTLANMYYEQGLESSGNLYVQRAIKYIDKAGTSTDIMAPAKVVGGITVSLLPILAQIILL